MAATVQIKELYGPSGSTSADTSTSGRFCTYDTPDPGTTYPLVKPEGDTTNYSYWKHYYLHAETSAAGEITNIKWYTDGTIAWTGVTVNAGTTSAYTEATGTSGVTGDEYTAVTLSGAANYTSAAPISVASYATTGVGRMSDYVVLQAAVTSAAGPGTVDAETITWRWDET